MALALPCAACGSRTFGRKERGDPLSCQGCGRLWPGRELPVPAHRVESSGWTPDRVSWGRRVRDMVAELERS